MGFDRFFGKGRNAALARKAELAGDFGRAVQLFAAAEEPAEIARVMVLRGDAEIDPIMRLQHYTQAAAVAPPGGAVAAIARRARARLIVAFSVSGGGENASGVARHDLLDAARTLEELGDSEAAAEAYARAGDGDGESRALAQAGDIENLERVLEAQQERERAERRWSDAYRQVERLAAMGSRREALAAAQAFALDAPRDFGDAPRGGAMDREAAERHAPHARKMHELSEHLFARRAIGPRIRVTVNGEALTILLGAEVVIGRNEGALRIASSAVSRRHLALRREGGDVIARDLGSRNGTRFRGLALAGPVRVGEGIEISLGNEVLVRIAPTSLLENAVAIDVAGDRYVAPLGHAALPIGGWRLELASDHWVELVTSGASRAVEHGVHLEARSALLVGDVISAPPAPEAVLRVLG